MKRCHLLPATLALLCLPAFSQLPMGLPAGGSAAPAPLLPAPATPALPSAERPAPPPVVAEAPAPGQEQPQEQLSEAEQRIRTGIIMLGRLHELLSHVKDGDSAEAAVAPVMRASAEFQTWAQGLSSLPPLDEDTQALYERRYLPLIDELNTRLKIQGERLESANYYGSQNLLAALVRLVTSMQ